MKMTKFTQTLLDFAKTENKVLDIESLYKLKDVLNNYIGTATKNDIINFYNFMLNNFIDNKILKEFNNIRAEYINKIFELEDKIEEKANDLAKEKIKELEKEIKELDSDIIIKDKKIDELESYIEEYENVKECIGDDVLDALCNVNFNNILNDEYRNLVTYISNFGKPNAEILNLI